MKTLNNIYRLINSCNIILEYQELPDDLLGVYHGDANMDMIIINQSICDDEILHRIILAEEVGHYFTAIGNNMSRKYSKYSDRLKVDKCEELAMRWATNFLVPDDQLLGYLSEELSPTIESCCSHFDVTNDFMIRKFEDMAKRKIAWPLIDGKYLVLSSLPSIYTMSMKGYD